MDLIYCGNGNYNLQVIALVNGFKYGLKLPQKKSLPLPLYFSDQDWKKPNKELYIESIKRYKPNLATVLDLEHRNQLTEVLSWAEEISPYVETIIIIPKCTGVIKILPREINGRAIRLGYSVPSSFGATNLKPSLFGGWETHLLGGSPEKQLQYKKEMNVVSVDCNYHSMEANKFGLYWTGKFNDTRWWRKFEGCDNSYERSLKAFNLSCKNIYNAWNISS